MTLPKCLAQITIDSTNDVLGYGLGGAQTADIADGTYDSILEVLAELEDKLQAVDATFAVTVSANGFVVITCNTAFTASWAATDDALETLLGFAGTESVAGSGPYTLTATLRHRAAFYPPVGGNWPSDKRKKSVREQETDDGDMIQYASSSVHRYREILFSLLTYAQCENGGTDSDGAGGSISWTGVTLLDFWEYVAGKKFRFYEDRSNGTVASPGTEGTDYVTCRMLYREPWEPKQPDQCNFALFDVELEWKIVGS